MLARASYSPSALRELGRGANRRFGQNFLTQPAFIERIAELAEISPGARTLASDPPKDRPTGSEDLGPGSPLVYTFMQNMKKWC